MSWLCDSTELISGGWLTSAYAGHGILAEDIPSTGEHGASVLYDQVTLPDDNGKEVRAEVLTTPSGLTTWYQDEDGTVDATAPDGIYTYTIQVYVDGVALGSPKTVTLTFGATGPSSSLAATGLPGTLSAASTVPVQSSALLTSPPGVLAASSSVSSGGPVSSLAATGQPGTLTASSTVQALSTAALACPAGVLVASTQAGVVFVMPAPQCLVHEPAEVTIVREPRETTIVRY